MMLNAVGKEVVVEVRSLGRVWRYRGEVLDERENILLVYDRKLGDSVLISKDELIRFQPIPKQGGAE